MNGVEYLKQLKTIRVIVNQLNSEKRELESKIYSIQAVDYSKAKVQTSNNITSYTLTDKHIDDTAAIEDKIIEYESKREKIKSEIRQLKDDRYIDVLYKRYVEFKSFNVIANETGYSLSNVLILHRKAVHEFEKLYSNL